MGSRLIIRFVRLFFGLFSLFLFCVYVGFYDKNNSQHQIDDVRSKSSSTHDDNQKSSSSCQDSNEILDYTDFTAKDVRALFYSVNEKACIRNEQQFKSPTRAAVKYVLLVMVHNRGTYLQYLIDSISKQESRKGGGGGGRREKGGAWSHIMNETLVIFSHDIFDADVFNRIEKITQFRVMQIGFPFSNQIFPDSFPGTDPQDCPRDISQHEAKKRNCLNANFPDSYGHYREAKFAALKHHWWWKLNYVMRNVVGSVVSSSVEVLLLEEDYYLAPDALSTINNLRTVAKSQCASCDFLQLGDYSKVDAHSAPTHFNTMRVDEYLSSRNNMALIVNKELYERLSDVDCAASTFCQYDDYNWDWSLNQVSFSCFKPHKLTVLLPTVPRVLHIGQCGVHSSKKEVSKNVRCNPDSIIANFVTAFQDEEKSSLSNEGGGREPVSDEDKKLNRISDGGLFKLQNRPENPTRGVGSLRKNGGWADPRDQHLCLKIAMQP